MKHLLLILCKRYIKSYNYGSTLLNIFTFSLCNHWLYKNIKFDSNTRIIICFYWNYQNIRYLEEGLIHPLDINLLIMPSPVSTSNHKSIFYQAKRHGQSYDYDYNGILHGMTKNNIPYGEWKFNPPRGVMSSIIFNDKGHFVGILPDHYNHKYNIIDKNNLDLKMYTYNREYTVHYRRGKNSIIECNCDSCNNSSKVIMEYDRDEKLIIFKKNNVQYTLADIGNGWDMIAAVIVYECIEHQNDYGGDEDEEPEDFQKIRDLYHKVHAPSRP